MSRRVRIIAGGFAACLAAVVAVVALGGAGKADVHGLSSQKVADLARHGITPEQYLRIVRRGAAHEAAARKAAADEPPPDPNVVGPRLIREQHESELLAWKQSYDAALHAKVTEAWSVQLLSERKTIVTLQLIAGAGSGDVLSEPAKWVINISLSSSFFTPAEKQTVHTGHAIEALNQPAHKLETLPAPRVGLGLPVDLYAEEVLSPGPHLIIVSISRASRYDTWLVMRRGVLDEPLLRGKSLVARASSDLKYLKLSKHVEVFEEPIVNGELKAGTRRRSSMYELNRLFRGGPVSLLLGWRKGARSLPELLRRPVQELVIVPIV